MKRSDEMLNRLDAIITFTLLPSPVILSVAHELQSIYTANVPGHLESHVERRSP
jgi:hypothetical protein